MSDMVNKRRVGRPETPLRVRFDAGYERGADDDCWIWFGATDKDGYGITSYKRKRVRAHRISWLLNNGDIPHGMFVCHSCDIPSCVNPSHLFLGTAFDNNRDRHLKRRSATMERAGNSRFTGLAVREMRRLHRDGFSYSEVGRRFNTSANTVRNAVLGITWASLNEDTK